MIVSRRRGRRTLDRPSKRVALRSILGHTAESSLRLEQLESRYLLAGDSWRWFESFDEVPRLAPAELAPPPRPADAVGPHDLVASEWIVQLTDDAARSTQIDAWSRELDQSHVDVSVISGLGSPGLILVRGESVEVADVEQVLAASDSVDQFSLNSAITGQRAPDDPEYQADLLPGLDQIDASAAWDQSIGSLGIVVGVVDGGIDATHPDLFLNMWLNQGEIPAALRDQLVDSDGDGLISFYDLNNLRRDETGIVVVSTGVAATPAEMTTATPFADGDNAGLVEDKNGNGRIDAIDLLEDPNWADGRDTDRNGFFDDFFGVNFRAGAEDPFADNQPLDELGHGTHVAGTIGAVGDNGVGAAGVTWQTSLMSLRILDNNNQGDSASAVRALNYARLMERRFRRDSDGDVIRGADVRVVNNSWGQPGGYDVALERSIRRLNNSEILFVAAAGNGNLLGNGVDNDRTPFYPAGYDVANVIAVAASDGSDQRASFSNFGDETVDVLAPGVGVRSTVPGGGYQSANGTSMASPHVAGAAALIWSANPAASLEEIREAILSVDSVDAVPGGDQIVSSGGRLNLGSAMSADVFAPAAQLIAKQDITVAGGASTEFTVQYRHDSGIDASTLGDNDLIVTRQWGPAEEFSVTLEPGSPVASPDGKSVTAVYQVSAPGGDWDPLDYGDYLVSTVAGSVESLAGDLVQAREVGTFNVRIDDPSVLYVDGFADTPGTGSLREAIVAANAAAPAARTIILETGTYTIDIPAVTDPASAFGVALETLQLDNPGGWNDGATGDFDVIGDLTIIGDINDDTVIDAQGLDRVFKVYPDASLHLQRLTVQGGVSPEVQGGGGILSLGDVLLDGVIARDNTAIGSDESSLIAGGAIAAWHGSASLNESWLTGNEADYGGGLYYAGAASGSVQRSTFDHNQGGGLDSDSSSDLSVANSTFSANVGGRGVIFNESGTFVANGDSNNVGPASIAPGLSADGRYLAIMSDASNLVPGDTNNRDDVFVYDRDTGTIERVSVSNDGTEANNDSLFASISADGRYVSFQSGARTLVPGDTNSQTDIFVHDRHTSTLERVSVKDDGTGGNGASYAASLSADGRYVLFASRASNLVPGDDNNAEDIFLYDRSTSTIDRVIVNNPGAQSIWYGRPPMLSANGRYVSYVSSADNIVPGDTNGLLDVFVYDRDTATTERVSVSDEGAEANGESNAPAISADGRYVMFRSRASNLVPEDDNETWSIFVYDRDTDAIELIGSGEIPSLSGDGRYVTYIRGRSVEVYDRESGTTEVVSVSDTGEMGNDYNNQPSLSADGRYVMFSSSSTNLAPGDVNDDRDVFLYDRTLDTITPVTYDAVGPVIDVSHVTITQSSGLSTGNVIRGDARVENSLFVDNQVVFDLDPRATWASASNTNVLSDLPQPTPITPLERIGNLPPVHRLILGNPAIDGASPSAILEPDQLLQTRVDPADIGAVEATTASVFGTVYVDANRSGAIDADETGLSGVGVTARSETTTNAIQSVSRDGAFHLDGIDPAPYRFQVDLSADVPWSVYAPPLKIIRNGSVQGNYPLAGSSFSADGRYVAFSSTSSNLVPGDNNAAGDVFVYDRDTGAIERVSLSDAGEEGNHWSNSPSLSADGRYVTFASTATNLVPGDNNDQRDVFVYDRNTKTLQRVNVSDAGAEANSFSQFPEMSADGRYVTFESNANNLVPGDNNGLVDVFVYDRNTSTIQRVSVSDAGTEGNGRSDFPSISSGRYVTFQSEADNLVPGDNNADRDAFVFDLETNTIERVSVNESGEEGDRGSYAPSISADGRYVTFTSGARNLVSGDNNLTSDIFVHDRLTNAVERVTVNNFGEEANSWSNLPALSGDGRYVTFESNASNLVPGDNNGVLDVFVYDRNTDTIARASVSDTGAGANARSFDTSLSADGQYLTFTSDANNLVPGDINGYFDVFIKFNPLTEPGVTLDLSAGEIYSGLDFGLVPDPGTISGRVFEDVVPNGVFDAGEPVQIATQVFLDLNENRTLDDGEPAVVPDADGRYEFAEIDSYLSYTITALVPSGYELTTPNADSQFAWNVFLPAGGNIADRDFAFRRVQSTGQSTGSAVVGRIYEDVNGNGFFDAGDIPVADQEVYLDAANFGVRDSNEPRVLTDGDGRYSIENLSARTVAVSTAFSAALNHVTPLGSEFSLQEFPLNDSIVPFANPQAIAASDFNGDGFADVAVALGEANQLSIRLNDQQGGFLSDPIDIDLGGGGAGPTSLVVAQLDSDPKLDVALSANFAGNVVVLLNFDPQSQSFASQQNVSVGQEPIDLVAGQFGGDAALDLVVVNKGSNSVFGDETAQVLTNDGAGVFTAGPAIPTGGTNSTSLVAGDFVGDGSLDVAVVHLSPSVPTTPFGGVTVLRGDGASGLVLEADSFVEVGAFPVDSVAADFDGDGRLDVGVANFASNSISILRGQAGGPLSVQSDILGTASGAFDITAGDIDNDGDTDLIAGNLLDRNISIFRNVGVDPVSGDVRFEPLENIGLGQFQLAQRMPLALANFDNDQSGPNDTGTLDIIAIPQRTDTLHLLSNRLVDGAHRVELTGLNQIEGLDFIVRPEIIPPTLDPIASPGPIDEDNGQQAIALTGINEGVGQELRFEVVSSNPALIGGGTVVHAAGESTATLTFQSEQDANGTAVLSVIVSNAGGNGTFGDSDDGTTEQSFTVTVNPVNDPPEFDLKPLVSATQKAGSVNVDGLVSRVSPGGGSDEAGQTLGSFVVTAGDPTLFSVLPSIDSQGRLSFTPDANKSGVTLVSVSLSDDGGVQRGGADTATKSFVINITAVNDAPSITLGGDLLVSPGAGPQSEAGFAGAFHPGAGDDDASQVIADFLVTADRDDLFAGLPDIADDGTLTFAPSGATGTATVTVQVRDNGGTADGGVDLSAPQTFTITVADAPEVESVLINDGSVGRSQVTSLTVTFSGEVDHTLLGDAFRLTNIDTNEEVGMIDVSASDVGGKTSAILTFSGASTVARGAGNSLANGNYRLDVESEKVTTPGGVLSMADDYQFGGQTRSDAGNDDFFRMFGDVDGDGDVDGLDYAALGTTFLRQSGDASFDGALDNDGDGDVDGIDYAAFGEQFLRQRR